MSEFPTIPYQRNRVSDAEMIDSACRFRETLALRRSVREFSSDPVPMEVVDQAIAAAASAPSGANQQPWTFVVVTDADVKRRIRIAAEEEERENYGGRMPPEWLAALAPLQMDWKKRVSGDRASAHRRLQTGLRMGRRWSEDHALLRQ